MALKLTKRDLSKYDLELILDVSGSMDTRDTPSGKSRLEDSKKVCSVLVAEMSKLDDDGMTICTGDTVLREVYENTTEDKAAGVLDKAKADGGGTDQAEWISARIDAYFERRFGKPGKPAVKGGFFGLGGTAAVPATPANPNCKPLVLVIITDGQPSAGHAGERKLINVIVNATKRLTAEGLDRNALGISFIQTGKDEAAKEFLDRLNNDLGPEGATMDIVNSLTMDDAAGLSTNEILEKALDD